jgi:predicted glycosyltransferase
LSRFFFYSHDGLGLGHVRRNLAVASALVELAPRASVLVATSAEEAERFGLAPRVDVLKLPGLRKLGNERYTARRLGLPLGEVCSVRASVLAAAVTSFHPDVLLADKHPFGVGFELEPALGDARASGVRTVLGLRDVLDDPAVVRAEWTEHGIFERINEYYDRVLVYGEPDVLDPRREYDFPDETAAMTRFCGYVVSQAGASPNGDRPALPLRHGDRPHVLATAGGGEDGVDLLATFVESAAAAGWQAEVVSGPQCERAKARGLRAAAAMAGVGFRRFAPRLASEFRSLDALVCMGGYNTLAEAVASGVPTVCVPRVHPRTEQLVRARAFAGRGLLRVLEPDRLDPAALRAEVERAFETPDVVRRRAVRSLDLDGAPRAARVLLELAGRPASIVGPVRGARAG